MQSPYTTPGAKVSGRTMAAVESFSRGTFELDVHWLDATGEILSSAPQSSDPLGTPRIQQAIRKALKEAFRWGEPFIFFICPGLIAWVVPMCNQDLCVGGILSGPVLVDEADRSEVADYLRSCGLQDEAAIAYAAELEVWPGEGPRAASEQLSRVFYSRSGWAPSVLQRRREKADQQRQVAEAIHSRKVRANPRYPLDEERRLLAMIRVGDRAGARDVLSQLLAALFLQAPGLVVLRVRAVELMGYLVRAAIEENPMLEPLMDQHQRWLVSLLEATSFDELCIALRDALDRFLETVTADSPKAVNPAVQRALDFIGAHFDEGITLTEVAAATGLSSYRIAHLVKDATGRTVMQHVRLMRIARAEELLERTSISGAEIAAQLGFHDQSHFIREFRSMTGTTPLQYRQGRPPRAPVPTATA